MPGEISRTGGGSDMDQPPPRAAEVLRSFIQIGKRDGQHQIDMDTGSGQKCLF